MVGRDDNLDLRRLDLARGWRWQRNRQLDRALSVTAVVRDGRRDDNPTRSREASRKRTGVNQQGRQVTLGGGRICDFDKRAHDGFFAEPRRLYSCG
jgi:hypothetical protein